MHEQYERDLVHLERSVALPDLHFVEAAAVAEPFLNGVGPARIERRTDRDAGELEDRLVAQRGVAVDADLGDLLGLVDWWGFLRGGLRDRRRDGENEGRDHLGTRIFEVTSALR